MYCKREAVLFGGQADGYAVQLDELYPVVTVFQNGGAPFVLAGDRSTSGYPDTRRLGLYELVEPLGPDRPVYVGLRA